MHLAFCPWRSPLSPEQGWGKAAVFHILHSSHHSVWQPDLTFDSLEAPAHRCRSTTPQTSWFLHSRKIFWDLIFLPVGQKDLSTGILAVILCMFFYQAGIDHWFYQCLCTYTHKIQQVEQWPSNEPKYLKVTSIAVWIFPIWKHMVLQLSVR